MSILDVNRHDSDCRRAWAQQEPQCGLCHFVWTFSLLDLWIPVRKQNRAGRCPVRATLLCWESLVIRWYVLHKKWNSCPFHNMCDSDLSISWNLLVSSFSRPTPHCSTRFWPPQMLCSNTSPNHLDFRLHDSGMPWVFLGWTSQKIRILGSNFLLLFLLPCYPVVLISECLFLLLLK